MSNEELLLLSSRHLKMQFELKNLLIKIILYSKVIYGRDKIFRASTV